MINYGQRYLIYNFMKFNGEIKIKIFLLAKLKHLE